MNQHKFLFGLYTVAAYATEVSDIRALASPLAASWIFGPDSVRIECTVLEVDGLP
jgi:hypothetical protein